MDEILKRLEKIEQLLNNQGLYQKEVLSFSEGCSYCGFTPSHMYKLTSLNTIPFYKPNGKMVFFRRSELDTWLLRNRSSSKEELEAQAIIFLPKKGRANLWTKY